MKHLRLQVRITDEEGNSRIPYEPISNPDYMLVRPECYVINERMYPALAKQHENITYGDVQKALEIIACYCMKSRNNGAILKLDEVERIYKEKEKC